jgi:hypothetical protein
MTDPERLKSGDADAFERSLLLAARSDAGSERALRKALSVFALGATVGLSGAAAAGGTQPAAVSGIVIAKWFGLGALAGILSATGVHTVQRELQSRDLKTTPNAAYAPKSSAQTHRSLPTMHSTLRSLRTGTSTKLPQRSGTPDHPPHRPRKFRSTRTSRRLRSASRCVCSSMREPSFPRGEPECLSLRSTSTSDASRRDRWLPRRPCCTSKHSC